MTDPRLDELFRRATDDLPVRDRGRPALARALVVRRRRRTAGAVSAAAAAVVAAIAVPLAVGGSQNAGPAPANTPSPPSETQRPGVTAPDVDPGDFPTWNPFSLADAPRASSALPETIAPPESAPSVLDDPLDAAVLAWPREDGDLLLLGTDGQWRSVPDTSDAVEGTLDPTVSPALTADGSTVAMSTLEGVLVIDIAAGEQMMLPWPGPLSKPGDTAAELRWMPGSTELIVEHSRGPWLMDLDGGARPAPWRVASGSVFVDPAGPLWQWRWRAVSLVELDDDGEPVGEMIGDWWGTRYVAGKGLVGFAGSLDGDNRAGPIVMDPKTGEVIDFLRAPAGSGEYTDNGYLRPVGFADADTLIMLVGAMSFRSMELGEEQWYVVEWNFADDEITVLGEGDTEMARAVVATGQLAD